MDKKAFTDQMGRKININFPPSKIISLVPSQTELLHFLGLEQKVLGITKFCVHPDSWFRNKTRVGGTKNSNFEKIKTLDPDLIIGNKEENQQEQIEALASEYPVWMSDIKTLDDALEMIKMIGRLTDRSEKATALADQIQQQFTDFKNSIASRRPRTVAYFIWKAPYMIAAGDTFINEMLQLAGYENIFGDLERYPEIPLQELSLRNPELIFLSSEPYPFKEKHVEDFKLVCPDAKIIIVDGELFSWYGSRLLHSIAYFKALHTQIW